MPIYPGRRRKKTFRVVVAAKGKTFEWVVEGLKKDAEAFEARKRVELEVGKPTSRRAVPTLREFCRTAYVPHAKKHLRPSTFRVRAYQLASLNEHLGDLKLTEFGPEAIDGYKSKRDVKASSVNNELRVLGTILNWARTLGKPVPDFKIKRLPERGAGRCRVWSLVELERLFEAARADTPEILPVFVFLVNTGCRKGEAIAAEWDWIDLAGGMVRIPVNDFWRPKSGRPREIPLSDALRAALAGPRRDERWLFPSRLGGRYAQFPKQTYGRIRTAAGLVGGAHTMRHTFASHFLAAVPDMFLLAKILGHSHQRVTELYSHLLPEHLSRARNAVNIGPAIKTMAVAVAGKPKGR